jgi:Retrotransposon gag protein/Zinc knuckle
LVGSSLIGDAQAWLNKLPQWPRTGNEMEEELRLAFTVQDRYTRCHLKLAKLQQGPEEKARALKNRMLRLIADAGEHFSDKQQYATFITALRPELRFHVRNQGATTMDRALKIAENAEKSLAEEGMGMMQKKFKNVSAGQVGPEPKATPITSTPSQQAQPTPSTQVPMANLQDQISKLQAELSQLTVNLQTLVQVQQTRPIPASGVRPTRRDVRNEKGEPLCFNCNEYGHFARGCSKPKKVGRGQKKEDSNTTPSQAAPTRNASEAAVESPSQSN